MGNPKQIITIGATFEMHSRELFDTLTRALTIQSSEAEKQAMIKWLLEDRTGLNGTDLMAGKEIPLLPRHFEADLERLNNGEPLQYLLGHAEFYGRKFSVNNSVLIPRPETELLVQQVIDWMGKNTQGMLLDIGTGSGCIAITLARELPNCRVMATDVDPKALAVAKENSRLLSAQVEFRINDILADELPYSSLDVVVSNPPYVLEREKKSMRRNVLGFEPHRALFVPDNDPLLFHRAIAQKGKHALKPGGLLGMEINEALGPATSEILGQAGYSNAVVHKDLDGKDRFVTATPGS